ncbi:MAG TPA: transcription antitermination factor NusB [Planctomycetota bacterium]|nr:transcription antitermination factor NusB [Planctomycetota bacterium]
MRRRTKAREYAVQFLYHLDLRGPDALEEMTRFLDAAEAEAEMGEDEGAQPARRGLRRDRELREFALRLIQGTHAHRAEVDKILAAVTRNWDLHRMAAIDRNILRMAIYELMYCPDIPPKVTINEAIELGKRFSTANSGSFINGILDRVRIDIEKGVLAAPARRPLEQGS